ncbi:hypothetical protein AB0F72_08840 [Actinoplanes sp. NPDC023936]|uniref:hypothetical protein n=1 Tax=Actinoplanes sp. NPDC023936 TaxID=3154910 RepID=UPI0033C0A2C9
MAVRGTTFEQRRATRAQRTRQNRLVFFTAEIRKAQTGRQRLQQACQYAKAVCDDLPEDARTRLALTIAQAAEAADKENAQ